MEEIFENNNDISADYKERDILLSKNDFFKIVK